MKRRRAFVSLATAATVGWVFAACGGGGAGDNPPANCSPADFDAGTPAVCPSWSTDVEPLISEYCGACHTNGGAGQSSFNASSYASIFAASATVSEQVSSCAMPEWDAAAQPTQDERQTIVSWIACKAPNN